MPKKITENEAIEAVRVMASHDGNPGDMTVGICHALGISFEQFLRYAQLDEKAQKRVVQGLALALLTKKLGHCSQ